MIDAGIYQRLKADAGVTSALTAIGSAATIDFDFLSDGSPGGLELQLISRVPQDLLESGEGMLQHRWQINSCGKDKTAVTALDRAVRNCLVGFSGPLPDPDATEVSGITVAGSLDNFDSSNRMRRRMTDFMVLSVES